MNDDEELIDAARAAARLAYAPYSDFAVGAALRFADGAIVTGGNVENASYGLSLCGETVALAKANSDGRFRDIVAIGVIGGMLDAEGALVGSAVVRPCGRCRQILNEAAQMAGCDIAVHCASADGSAVETHLVSELLPHAFGPADLGLAG